jgi:hypothetical protein
MKPGVDVQRTVVLPHALISAEAAVRDSSLVSWPRITSTRRMTGGGLKK